MIVKMKKQNNKIVVFDWGGVVESHKNGEYSWNYAIENLLKRFNSNLEGKNIVQKYLDIKIKVAEEKLENPSEESFRRIKEAFNLKCTIEEFNEAYPEELNKIEYYKDVVNFIHSLKKYCKIGILSSLDPKDKVRIDKQMNLKKFDYVWLSFELKCNKPNREIYQIVEKDCGLEPKNILFVDDTEKNLEIPKEKGWQVLHANGHELEIIKRKVNEFLF